jgi:hypothetical protein
MIAKNRNEWINDPKLSHWDNRSCTHPTKCECNNPNLIELCDHDSCVRGEIDTVICVKCDAVKRINIIR